MREVGGKVEEEPSLVGPGHVVAVVGDPPEVIAINYSLASCVINTELRAAKIW